MRALLSASILQLFHACVCVCVCVCVCTSGSTPQKRMYLTQTLYSVCLCVCVSTHLSESVPQECMYSLLVSLRVVCLGPVHDSTQMLDCGCEGRQGAELVRHKVMRLVVANVFLDTEAGVGTLCTHIHTHTHTHIHAHSRSVLPLATHLANPCASVCVR